MAAPEFSPRLRSVLDSCFADLNDDGVRSGFFSIADSFDPNFKSAIDPQDQADNVTAQAQRLAMLGVARAVEPVADSRPGSSFLPSFVPGRLPPEEAILFKRPSTLLATSQKWYARSNARH